MNIYLVVAGSWLAIDGLGSIIFYRKQKWTEHAIRVVRMGIGLALIVGGLHFW